MTLDDMLALVDLDRYPVDRLDSPAGAALVSFHLKTAVLAVLSTQSENAISALLHQSTT